MILNHANDIMYGSNEVDRVWCGNTIVWQRGTTLDEIGLTLNGTPIRTDTIIAHGIKAVTNWGDNGYPSPDDRVVNAYYDYTAATGVTDAVSIYTGGVLPPAIYIPQRLQVYQNGVSLKKNSTSYFHVITGYNQLFFSNSSTKGNGLRGFFRYGVLRKGTEGTYDTTFGYGAGHVDGNGLKIDVTYCYASSESTDGHGHSGVDLSVMSSGVATTIPKLYSDGDALVSLIENAAGIRLILTDENIINL